MAFAFSKIAVTLAGGPVVKLDRAAAVGLKLNDYNKKQSKAKEACIRQ